MNVPSEDDWLSEPWTIDTPYAYQHFCGRTIADTSKLFADNALYYLEDLMFMPSRVFRYYIKAYTSFLLSEESCGESDAASYFITLVAYRAEYNRDDIVHGWSEIEPVLKRLAFQQDYYDTDWVFEGDFRARIHEIVELGFTVSFDTTGPECIPDGVTIRDVAGALRTFPIDVALPILRNSGIEHIDGGSTLEQVIMTLGEPHCRGGGIEAKFGFIPVWIRYQRIDCQLRFEFEENRLHCVTFMALD